MNLAIRGRDQRRQLPDWQQLPGRLAQPQRRGGPDHRSRRPRGTRGHSTSCRRPAPLPG